MTKEGWKRKLTALLSADVEGYSRLMGEDEEATILTLTSYRQVMTAHIQQHGGRVVDSPGDNLLAEFASAVDAVQGAVAIQRELKTRNAELPPHRRMEYRIGINVGDVLVGGSASTAMVSISRPAWKAWQMAGVSASRGRPMTKSKISCP